MKTHKHDIQVFTLLTINFLGILLPFHKVILMILMLMYLFFLRRWVKEKSIAVPKLIALSFMFQNTFMGIGMHLFGVAGESITLYSQVATMYIFIAAAWIILYSKNKMTHMLFCLYLVIICFNFVISSNHSLTSFAYNTRNFTVFYLAYVIGAYLINQKQKFNDFKRFIIRISMVACFVGILGYITNEQLYIWLGAAEVSSVKAMNIDMVLLNGLPGYFYGDFFGHYYLRLGSLFLEPVNFSSFLALPIILKATELKNKKDCIQLIVLVICQFLTFGKGGMLITAMAIFSAILYGLMPRKLGMTGVDSSLLIKWGIIVVVMGGGLFYGTAYSYNLHFHAIRITLAALMEHPFGFGIGSVGNFTRDVFSMDTLLGAETGVLNFWCQLGIEGLIVFIALLWKISKQCFKARAGENTVQVGVFAILPIILFLVFFFQENTFTTQVITGYMLIIGYISQINKTDRQTMISVYTEE